MFCSVFHLDQATRFSHKLLAPMCSTPQASCSRTQISDATALGCSLSRVKRKRGICLTINPVLQGYQDQEEFPTRSSTGLDHHHKSGSRSRCEFVTFKGPNTNSQYRTELGLEQDFEAKKMAVPTDEDRARYGSVRKASYGDFKEKIAARDTFQTVDLNGKEAEKEKETKTKTGTDDTENDIIMSVQQLATTSLPPANGKTHFEKSPEGSSKICHDTPKAPFPFVGIVGTILSSTFFSLSLLCVKLIPDSNSMAEKTKAVWFRGFFFALMSALTMLAQGTSFKINKQERWLMFFRTSIGFFGSLGGFTSLQYITMGESISLIYLSILWTAILGYFVLKEPFPLTLIFAIPMAMFGIILIAHPDLILGESVVEAEVLIEVARHNHQLMLNKSLISLQGKFNQSIIAVTHPLDGARAVGDMMANVSSETTLVADNFIGVDPDAETKLYFDKRWPGILIATGTSFVASIVMVILKYRKTTPIQTCTLYLGLGSMLMASCIQCFVGFGRWPDTFKEWVLLFCMGVCSWCGQNLMQWALQYEKASILGIVRTFDLVLAFCWGALILDEDILWTSILGTSMILVIVVILVLNDRLEKIFCSTCKK